MNKEEIIKYLKEKIKTNQDFIQTIEKNGNDSSKTKDDMINNSKNDVKYYKEIINYIEEKDKVINKVSERLKLLGKYDGETCTRNFKMMSADFNQLIEWLERGKNGK